MLRHEKGQAVRSAVASEFADKETPVLWLTA